MEKIFNKANLFILGCQALPMVELLINYIPAILWLIG